MGDIPAATLTELKQKHKDLSDERIQEFWEAFNLFDGDGSGQIDSTELQQVMNKLAKGSQHIGLAEVKEMIRNVDANGDEMIDFVEFVDLMVVSIKSEKDELKDAFDVFDVDGDGQITAEEIMKVLQGLGQNITTEEIRLIMDDVDLDKNGLVDFAEFSSMMALGPRSKS